MYNVQINGISVTIEAEGCLFSPNGLDIGTHAMLTNISISCKDKVLDLGCGSGIVGIYVANIVNKENVVMCDIDPKAVESARQNVILNGFEGINVVQSDGFASVSDTDFSLILSNPPYHTDFSVAKHFIEEGYKHLALGGKLVMITKRLEWYKNKLATIFGGVTVIPQDGYYIFISEKRIRIEKAKNNKNALSKKLMRKQSRKK